MKRSLLAVLLAFLLASCSAQTAAPPTTEPTPPPVATATATALPSYTPTPQPSPTLTLTATIEPTGVGMEIDVIGSDAFTAQAEAALALLAACAPDALAEADVYLVDIVESDRSGMDVQAGTFLASEITAFAPGYSQPAQVFWFGGSIIHDARHRWQSENGISTNWDALSLAEREEIEADARGVQIEALQQCLSVVEASAQAEAEYMLQYLTDMQAGLIPCDYCEVEWEGRNW